MFPEPSATYRLQLRPGFGFDEAAEIAQYLADLGISHLYLSPYLQAASGSTHGYDIVDPGHVNSELGGGGAHARLCLTLKTAGLGQIIDVVPNHMAMAGRQNPWWWDVLEDGPSSRYATYFDVDWEASEDRWPNKILLPVLGDHYGRILEDGQLRLSHQEGVFTLHYQGHVFPVDPSSLGVLLAKAAESCGSEVLAFLAQSHARLPRPTITDRQQVIRRHRDKAVLADLLARICREEPSADAAINDEVALLNQDPAALDELIDQQNYRLAFWRTASRDLGYRRFFDIKDLVGLRVEDIDVFFSTHLLPITWLRDGLVQGLRIDHPDGLRDPLEYFRRLRDVFPESWIVAEKILTPPEKLPSDWPIDGTTGYDMLNLVGGLFIDPNGKQGMTRIYEEFTGGHMNMTALVRECKHLVITELLGSELNRLTSLFVAVCERHRRHRDYTSHELREALSTAAVCFPVYRSYVSAIRNSVGLDDEIYISRAMECAVTQRPDLDPELFHFLKDLLLLRRSGSLEEELAMRFQQMTAAVMAKGLEDTAFYRYNRLMCLNEVGGDPMRFGVSPAEFHRVCAEAAMERPLSMNASTTHDTKRSEDVRSRLALLSEIPRRWAAAVKRWSALNEGHRRGDVPDRNTEYLFYQTLVGAWPIDFSRMSAYMGKAAREAKVHTSWFAIDEGYERDLQAFIRDVLQDDAFILDLSGFVHSLITPGRINSMSQTLIKLTAPGVPDIYQGSELWDMGLVDPDNRRPVDFELRRALLQEMNTLSPEDIMDRMDEGMPKLWVIRQALHLRRERPDLFGPKGSYLPLMAEGSRAAHVVAYIRGKGAIAVVPRLILRLKDNWSDTALTPPEGNWVNILTGDRLKGEAVPVGELLSRFPVALLVREE